MIKLIATDMDGCFLHNDKSLPSEAFNVIEKCVENNIKFTIASGRSYSGLAHLFSPVKDKIAVVCENGAYVKDGNEEVYASVLDKVIVHRIIDKVSSIEHTDMMLCTSEVTYSLKEELINADNFKEMQLYYNNIVFVDDLKSVNDDILKICICNTFGSEINVYPFLKQFNTDVEVVVSAFAWVDCLNLGNNKGNGILKLQEKFGINSEETICFGDYLNDLEMFKMNSLSIAVGNAHPVIKKYANKVIGSNEEDAVVDEIYRIIKNNNG